MCLSTCKYVLGILLNSDLYFSWIFSVCTSVLHETEEDLNDGASGLVSGLVNSFSFCFWRIESSLKGGLI